MGDKKQTRPKRIFINDVDVFSSRHLAKFLSTCTTGGNLEEIEGEETVSSQRREPAFQVVGTTSTDERDSCLLEQYKSPSRDELLEHLLQCDIVVYNVSENATPHQLEEATWAVTALNAEMENFKSRKMFILVSTVMTWALTKPHNPDRLDEVDIMITEEEFRKRRPHLNFKNHHNLEKLVLKLAKGKKTKLNGYVVASGLQYGRGENIFHYFFKVSWLLQFPEVPLFGQGTNYIPTIHVDDLGGVLQNLIELKPKTKYILALDDSKNTLEEIVKMISDTLGPGKINKIPEQEAITMGAFTVSNRFHKGPSGCRFLFQPSSNAPDSTLAEELDYLSISLRLDAFTIKDLFILRWTSEAGMVENIRTIIEEYKHTRQLLPIRICLVGPPAVGKTTVAEKLCGHYRLHHVQIKEMIQEKFKELTEEVNGEHVSEEAAAVAQKQLETLHKSMKMNDGRLAEHILFDILQEKLSSKPCRNQGFVLDGFPKTYEQAKMVFSDDDSDMSRRPVCNKTITPEHVFALNATDDFLTKRVQELPQSVAEEMRYTQEEFVTRLERYRKQSVAEETALDYFDELEILPEHIEVTTGDSEYTDVMEKITEMVGVPKNYGPSPEERAEQERKKEEERRRKVAAEAAERKHRNEDALSKMAAQYEEWRNLSEVNRQECELLEARALPLRNYLMKYVMPTLTQAMLECSKIKPDDPVNFLAEHLLQNSQEE